MTRPPTASRFSVRQRLTVAVALLTFLSLLAVGVTLLAVETERTDIDIVRGMSREMTEFRTLQERGVDPDTQKRFSSADRLLEVFLERNLPGRDETFWAFPIAGKPFFIGPPDTRLQRSPAFARLVARLGEAGGSRTLRIGQTNYRVSVQPVRQGSRTGAFVITHDTSASRAPLRDLITTYILLALISLLIIAGLASWIAGRLLSPVRRLRDTALGIYDGDLSGRLEVTGHDDLTDLQRTFNDMLDRLEASAAAQRHLLDDAGHELRTPLTVLRGNLEVLDPHDPEDVKATRTLLLDEIDRMSRLVGDLLMLAKARRPDFVEPQPTDVEALTYGVLARARALADRRWVLDNVATGTAHLDSQRITQAMLQLSDNAVQHTAEGSEIGLGSRLVDGDVELWVRDTGVGVPAEIRDEVFERFTRGQRNDDGFGLGLSIVRAIARAHSGEILLDNTESGATFRLRIPASGGP